jgi:hypothetical protein
LNKKTCCGCGCLLIIIIIIAIVVGGYYGVSFLHTAGKDFAAATFEKGFEIVTEKAFNQENRKEIIAGAKEVAKGIKSGDIGLISMFAEGSQQLIEGVYGKIILLAFKNHYMLQAEDGAEATFSVEGAKSVDRMLYGMQQKRIPFDHVASVTNKLTQHIHEKIPSEDGKSNVKFSGRRINTKLTRDEVLQCLDLINKTCELNNIGQPGEDFEPETEVKNEILQMFERMKKGESAKLKEEKADPDVGLKHDSTPGLAPESMPESASGAESIDNSSGDNTDDL